MKKITLILVVLLATLVANTWSSTLSITGIVTKDDCRFYFGWSSEKKSEYFELKFKNITGTVIKARYYKNINPNLFEKWYQLINKSLDSFGKVPCAFRYLLINYESVSGEDYSNIVTLVFSSDRTYTNEL